MRARREIKEFPTTYMTEESIELIPAITLYTEQLLTINCELPSLWG